MTLTPQETLERLHASFWGAFRYSFERPAEALLALWDGGCCWLLLADAAAADEGAAALLRPFSAPVGRPDCSLERMGWLTDPRLFDLQRHLLQVLRAQSGAALEPAQAVGLLPPLFSLLFAKLTTTEAQAFIASAPERLDQIRSRWGL